jgi:hypothetical protein
MDAALDHPAWAPTPDARSITARYSGTCVSCRAPFAPGQTITGTPVDGWACQSCVTAVGGQRTAPDWALPVGARRHLLRWDQLCRLCGQNIPKGTQSWPNVLGGEVCDECKNTVPPTYPGIRQKLIDCFDDQRPTALSRQDLQVLVELAHTFGMDGHRRGAQENWKAHTSRWAWESSPSPLDILGYYEDALEHHFNPGAGHSDVLLHRIDGELAPETPYDEELDGEMRARGWRSYRQERAIHDADLMFDAWSWGPSDAEITIQAIGNGRYELIDGQHHRHLRNRADVYRAASRHDRRRPLR